MVEWLSGCPLTTRWVMSMADDYQITAVYVQTVRDENFPSRWGQFAKFKLLVLWKLKAKNPSTRSCAFTKCPNFLCLLSDSWKKWFANILQVANFYKHRNYFSNELIMPIFSPEAAPQVWQGAVQTAYPLPSSSRSSSSNPLSSLSLSIGGLRRVVYLNIFKIKKEKEFFFYDHNNFRSKPEKAKFY